VYEIENLTDVYADEHRHDLAEPLARRVLTISETHLGPNHAKVAAECNRLGNVLLGERKFADAEPVFRRALSIIESQYGSDDLRTATYVENLARYYNRSGRYSDADPLYRRALGIVEKHLPDAAARFATLENNFAVFLRDQGRYLEALGLIEKINAPGPGAPAPSSVQMENLADIYARLGYYSKALPLLMKAMDSAQLGEGSPGHRLLRLGQLDAGQQHYTEAAASLEQALALAQKSGDMDAQMVDTEALANVKRDSRQFAEAARLYNQVSVWRERETPDSHLLAELLDDMGLLAIRQGRLADAEPLLVRALRIYERAFSTENAPAALCTAHLAMLYREQKRLAEAEPLFRQSLAAQERTMGKDAPVLAITLREFAQLLLLRNRGSEAALLEARARNLAPAGAPGTSARAEAKK